MIHLTINLIAFALSAFAIFFAVVVNRRLVKQNKELLGRLNLLQEELNKETEAIRGVKEILTLAIERFEDSSSPTIDLRHAEGSFAQVLKDYSSELESIVYWIGKLLRTL